MVFQNLSKNIYDENSLDRHYVKRRRLNSTNLFFSPISPVQTDTSLSMISIHNQQTDIPISSCYPNLPSNEVISKSQSDNHPSEFKAHNSSDHVTMSSSLAQLRDNYNEAKNKYLEVEKSVSQLQTQHERDLDRIKSHFMQNKISTKANFDSRLQRIKTSYLNKIKNLITKNNDELNHQLITLNKEIKQAKKEIDYVSRCSFKEQQAALQNKYKEKNDFIRQDSTVKYARLEEKRTNYEQQKDVLKGKIEDLIRKRDHSHNKKLAEIKKKINKINDDRRKLEDKEMILKLEITALESNLKAQQDNVIKLKSSIRELKLEKETIAKSIIEEQNIRRVSHNKLQELKGNIRVYCRLKPEKPDLSFPIMIGKPHRSLTITETKEKATIQQSPSKQKNNSYTFNFDCIFDQNSTNSEIFDEISQLVQSALDGYNVCIFTYGQTSSGKTYTMLHPEDGIILKSLKQILEQVNFLSKLGGSYELYGQFFEIYGDSVRDLLSSSSKYNAHDINHVSRIKLTKLEEVETLLFKANNKRFTASTAINNESSRSHSIFRISIVGINEKGDAFDSILNLVDLAGSERISQSQVTGARLKETQAINKSLSALGDVIMALHARSTYIPYRNSKLTYLLKDSLSGDAKTLMFVNISCLKYHFSESLNSLRFASKVNNAKLN